MIQSTNPKAKIILHRDRDFLSDNEVEEWKKDVRACSVEPFVTLGRDIEALFINPKYLAEVNGGHSEEEFEQIITEVLDEHEEQLIQDYVNGRVELARKAGKAGNLNHGQLAIEGKNVVTADPKRYAGKSVLRGVRARFQSIHKANMSSGQISKTLADSALATVASKVPKAKTT